MNNWVPTCRTCDHNKVCTSYLNSSDRSLIEGCRDWNGWIPISSGILPEVDKDYVLLLLNNDVVEKEDNMVIGMYSSNEDNENKWYIGHITLVPAEDDSWVIAWRLLPSNELQ